MAPSFKQPLVGLVWFKVSKKANARVQVAFRSYPWLPEHPMSSSLNSLKEVIKGFYREYFRGYLGDTWSSYCGSYYQFISCLKLTHTPYIWDLQGPIPAPGEEHTRSTCLLMFDLKRIAHKLLSRPVLQNSYRIPRSRT